MADWEARLGLECPDLAKPRRGRRRHVGNVVDEQVETGVEPSEDAIEEVDQPFALQHIGDLDRLGEAQSLGMVLVDGIADAEWIIGPNLGADLLVDHAQEPHPVFQGAAEFVAAAIDHGRQKLSYQVAAGHGLDAIKPALTRPAGGLAELAHDARDIVAIHLMGEVAVIVLARMRGAERGKPRAYRSVRPPADMRDLTHHCCAMAMNARGKFLKDRNDRIAREIELRAAPTRIGGDTGGAAEHRQRQTAFRLLLVIALIGFERISAVVEGGLVAGAHDPVAQIEPADPQRPQQRIRLPRASVAAPVGSPDGFHSSMSLSRLLFRAKPYAGPSALRMASTHCFKGGVGSTLYFQLVSSIVSEPS